MFKFIKFIICFLILFLIITKIDFIKINYILDNTNLSLILFSIIFFLPQIFISSFRFKYILGKININLKIYNSTKLILLASSFNTFLPGRLGDILKGLLIKQNKLSNFDIIFLGLYEKIFDLSALILIMTIFATSLYFYSSEIMLLSIFYLSLFLILHFNLNISKSFYEKKNFSKKLSKNFYNLLKQFSIKKGFLYLILISLILWFFHLLQFYVFIKAFGINVSITSLFPNIAICLIIGLIPITPNGIGTRDLAFIYFFKDILGLELTVILSMFSHFRYFLPAILGLLFLKEIKSVNISDILKKKLKLFI